MGYKLGQTSMQNLSGVNPDLQSVVERAIEISEKDFTVLEGIRNVDRQKELFKSGKSTTMNSRHLTGHAVDIAPWPISWEWEDFDPLEKAIKKAAKELKISIVWGGDWDSFPDGPHWELDWKKYP